MVKTLLLVTLLSVTANLFAQQDKIVGTWKRESDNTRQTEIYRGQNGKYFGKVINDKGEEPKNGHILLKNLVFDPTSNTFKGKLSPPDKDVELDAVVSFVSKDKLAVKAKMLFIPMTIYLIKIQ